MAVANPSLPDPERAHLLTTPWYSVGQRFNNLSVWGRPAPFPVVNERAVRATAGIVMALAIIAISLAFFEKNYWPVRIISIVIAVDYVLRIFTGLTPLSPIGMAGTLLVHNQAPEWVGVSQKRFAWSLGLAMVVTIAILTNAGIEHVFIPSFGLLLIVLLWSESVLGFCVGCFTFSMLIKGNVIHPEDAPACGGNSCDIGAGRVQPEMASGGQ